jgi:Leucine-rich repeat (LRR) protein
LDSLEKIDLSESSIKTIEGLETLKNLKKVFLYGVKQLDATTRQICESKYPA